MSFILDALKKSEADRQQQSSGEFSSVPTAARPEGPPRWIWVLGGLLIVNVVVLGTLVTRSGDDRGAAATPAAAPAATQAAAGTVAERGFAERLREAPPQPRSAESGERTVAASSDALPAETSPAPRPAAAARSAPIASEALPTLTEVRLNDGVQLPDMNLDIHVYAESSADRFVFINMRKLGEGELLDSGARLDEITPDGVVMSYRGARFVLPRE